MSEWKECTLADIAKRQKGAIISGPFGSNISSKYFVEEGVPVIRGNNVSKELGTRFIDSGFVFLTEQKAKELGTWATKDDLVFTAAGTIGQVGIIPENGRYERYIISNKQLRVTLDIGLIDPIYAYFWFASSAMQRVIESCDTGSTIPLINLSVLRSLPVLLPPLPEQKAIASVLSSLDDKIDLLHRQNKTLEAMAETLFRQWFVEEGTTLFNITQFVEFNPKRQLAKNSIAPYLEMANVSTSVFHPEYWYDREFKSGTKFINGDTLLARITPCLENGKSSFVTFLNEGQTGWGSTEYIVMRSKDKLHPMFTYALARNDDFRGYAEGCLEGSSGRQRVNVDHLMNYELYLPEEEKIDQFNSVSASIVPKLDRNFRQIKTLEKLRKILLPKLMSGEVRIIV
jgi:type I restriction enzyme, S subunit